MFRPVQHRSRFPRDNTPAIPASRNTRRPRPETGPEETGTRPLLATSYLPPRCAPGPGHTHADGRPRPRCRARVPRPPAAAGPAAGTPPGRQGLAPAGGLAAPKRRPARRREDADGRRGRPDRAVPLLTEAGGGGGPRPRLRASRGGERPSPRLPERGELRPPPPPLPADRGGRRPPHPPPRRRRPSPASPDPHPPEPAAHLPSGLPVPLPRRGGVARRCRKASRRGEARRGGGCGQPRRGPARPGPGSSALTRLAALFTARGQGGPLPPALLPASARRGRPAPSTGLTRLQAAPPLPLPLPPPPPVYPPALAPSAAFSA